MNETKPACPRLRLDDQGRAIPFTPAERQARFEALRLALEEIHAVTDDPSEVTDLEVFRAIDRQTSKGSKNKSVENLGNIHRITGHNTQKV